MARKAQTRQASRLSIALWALLISAVCGWQVIGEPLDDLLRGARNVIRARPADGSVAIVGVDDASLDLMGGGTHAPMKHAWWKTCFGTG